MATQFILKVGGTTLPCPSKFDWSIQDVSAGESGRTDDGVMHKNRVTRKRKIALSWAAKNPTVTSQILKAFAPEYISVYYWDAEDNQYETRRFYTGDKSAPVWRWFTGTQIFESISFDIIEV